MMAKNSCSRACSSVIFPQSLSDREPKKKRFQAIAEIPYCLGKSAADEPVCMGDYRISVDMTC